jgi:hypothetical protein
LIHGPQLPVRRRPRRPGQVRSWRPGHGRGDRRRRRRLRLSQLVACGDVSGAHCARRCCAAPPRAPPSAATVSGAGLGRAPLRPRRPSTGPGSDSGPRSALRRQCSTATFHRPRVGLGCPPTHRRSTLHFAHYDRRSALEAGLRSNQAAWHAAQPSPAASSGPRRPTSPAVSDTGSDSRSRASTDDAADSLEALLGVAKHDLDRYGLSSPWATTAKRAGSKMLPDDIANLSSFLLTCSWFSLRARIRHTKPRCLA